MAPVSSPDCSWMMLLNVVVIYILKILAGRWLELGGVVTPVFHPSVAG